MLQILEQTHGNVIATKAYKSLKPSDYEKLHPIIHNILEDGKKVRWFLEVSKLEEWPSDKNMVCINHAEEFEKICLIGAEELDNRIVALLVPFKNAKVRFFTVENFIHAQAWINE